MKRDDPDRRERMIRRLTEGGKVRDPVELADWILARQAERPSGAMKPARPRVSAAEAYRSKPKF